MQVKYPLCGQFTVEFLMAIVDIAYETEKVFEKGPLANTQAYHALQSARSLATVDGLIWG